eukprot:symbB.v1.2.026200.t1/scaffold2557.1/size76417/5
MSPILQHPPPRPPPAAEEEDLSEEEGLDKAVLMTGDEFDSLGFVSPVEGDNVGQSALAYAQWFQAKAMRRLHRLELRRAKLKTSGDWSAVPKSTLKALLRKGIPPEYRPEVWWSILGCAGVRQSSPTSYHEYLQGPVDAATCATIECDLPRTFPNHKKFRCASGRAELRNVLRAFARRVPAVRYCQGLNFIAALLLVVFQNEEQAFWTLVCAFDALGCEGYYTDRMLLLRTDMQVLGTFMKVKCPKVAKELNRLNVELMSICSEWFITWFAKSLPVSTVLRVWDTLFFEGFKVFFRVSMGIFKQIEEQVMACQSFDAVMERAKGWPRCMVQHNELLKASFQGLPFLKRQALLRARDEAMLQIEREDEERAKKAEARLAQMRSRN